jgi:hypothetical protein
MRRFLASDFALSSGSGEQPRAEETELQLSQVNVGLAAGFGSIILGLTILVIGLLWSATRRLRNLPDDPGSVRGLIVAGLALAAVGVALAAFTVNAG